MSTPEPEQPDAEPTVRDRMTRAGISPDSLERAFRAGHVQVDGEVVTDLDQPAPPPARILFTG